MTTRIKALSLAALLLPLVFLGVETAMLLWQRTHAQSYTVVVGGYDPRDLLHGEYLQFRLLWDDEKSERPEGVETGDLPATLRMYLPEGNAWDLQEMLLRPQNENAPAHDFRAKVILAGKDARIQTLVVDGKPWAEALDAWRMKQRTDTQ